MKNRKIIQIPVIDTLRGIAAVAVCFYHFVVTTTGFVNEELIIDIFHYGKRGVQLFFIISGIVIPLSMIKSEYKIKYIARYLLRRFVRIEPPYLVAVLLGIIYLYVRNFVSTSADVDLTPTLRDTLLHIGYLVPFVEGAKWINPVFWTLSVEFQYYIFLAILFPLALSQNRIHRWGFNALILLVYFTTYAPSFFTYWSAYFGIGIIYALYISEKASKMEFIITFLFYSVAVWYKQGAVDLAIAWGALSVIHFFSEFKPKIGLFFGKISYSLYLLHSIVGAAYINFMSHRVSSPLEKTAVIISGFLISVLSAYLFWKLIELPSQKKSKTIKLK